MAANVAMVVIVIGAVFGGASYRVFANLLFSAIVVAAILVCTATGIGSIWLGGAGHLSNLAWSWMFVRRCRWCC